MSPAKTLFRAAMAVAAFGFALISSSAPVSAAGEGPVTIPLPRSYFEFEAVQSPKVIGRRTWTPVSLHLSGKLVGERQGLGIEELKIDLDRHLSLNAQELPTCKPHLGSRGDCKRALIGEGTATILLASEDPQPIDAHLSLYNGGVRGGAADLYLEVRLPERFHDVAYRKVRVRPVKDGIFGSKVEITIPPLVGGEGTLISFDLAIEPDLEVEGEDVPVLTAVCPSGKIVAQGRAELGDGETSVAGSVRACTPGTAPMTGGQGHQGGDAGTKKGGPR